MSDAPSVDFIREKLRQEAIANVTVRREFTSAGVICTIDVQLPKTWDAGVQREST